MDIRDAIELTINEGNDGQGKIVIDSTEITAFRNGCVYLKGGMMHFVHEDADTIAEKITDVTPAAKRFDDEDRKNKDAMLRAYAFLAAKLFGENL